MKQVLIIHGGESYSSYSVYLENLRNSPIAYDQLSPKNHWKPWIAEQMPDADVLLPRFPNSNNAVYDEWKIYFEKLLPFLTDDVHIIGHSLGAMFLAKYLHANPLNNKIRRLILIAGVYDDSTDDNGSFLVGNAAGLEKSAMEIHLFHSKDDPVVPYSEMAKFQNDLTQAIAHSFDNRGHFNDETFPEILEILQKD